MNVLFVGRGLAPAENKEVDWHYVGGSKPPPYDKGIIE